MTENRPRPAFLIFGTTGGIGSALVRRLAQRGASLFLLMGHRIKRASPVERQAVAIRSDSPCLPPFRLAPKLDQQRFSLAGLANQVITWAAGTHGTPAQFPHQPDFAARWVVVSDDPEGVHRFFDDRRAHDFTALRPSEEASRPFHIEHFVLRAEGDLFVFNDLGAAAKPTGPAQGTRRIERAFLLYRLLQR